MNLVVSLVLLKVRVFVEDPGQSLTQMKNKSCEPAGAVDGLALNRFLN